MGLSGHSTETAVIGWADVSACTHVCSYVNWRYIVSGHRDEAAGGYTLFSVSPSESFSLDVLKTSNWNPLLPLEFSGVTRRKHSASEPRHFNSFFHLVIIKEIAK